MDKEKLLRDIGSDLSTLQGHMQRLRKTTTKIHPLDVDLLLENTRKLYDKILGLEGVDEYHKTIVLPETMPEAELPEVSMSSQTIIPEPEVIADKAEVEKEEKTKEEISITAEVKEEAVVPEVKIEPKKEEKHEDLAEEKIEVREDVILDIKPDPIPEPVAEEPSIETEDQNEPEPHPPVIEQPSTPSRSAFDLFTSNAETTIGDKLSKNDASVADKIQQSQIADLRQAIGINEKFLFINELFNGDLGRYNKAIDEFNEFKSQQGIDTHLLEMKIQNQWQDDGEAYTKLKTLLDRKFG